MNDDNDFNFGSLSEGADNMVAISVLISAIIGLVIFAIFKVLIPGIGIIQALFRPKK